MFAKKLIKNLETIDPVGHIREKELHRQSNRAEEFLSTGSLHCSNFYKTVFYKTLYVYT